MTRVSITKIDEHQNLYEAINYAINLIGKFDIKDKKVLLKPNCLMPSKDAITNPILLGNVAKWVMNNGGIPMIGDSPMSGGKTARDIYKKVIFGNNTGFNIFNEIAGKCDWISFQDNPILISKEENDFIQLKSTVIAANFVNADFIINMPKWKTHFLTRFTGGVKNYWGIQPGKSKTNSHSYGNTSDKFSMLIADLYSYVKKINKDNLVIMDAIDVMHGNGGPSYGLMRHLGLILASDNSVSLDSIAVSIANMDPFKIKTLKYCHERNLGIADPNQIEVLGKELKEVQVNNLSFPITTISDVVGIFQPIYNRVVKKIPRVKRIKCSKCGTCIDLCPTNSIRLNEYSKFPEFNRTTCISCLCCAEGCPSHAIRASNAGIRGILGII